MTLAPHQRRPQDDNLYLAFRAIAQFCLEPSLAHSVAAIDQNRCQRGEIAIF